MDAVKQNIFDPSKNVTALNALADITADVESGKISKAEAEKFVIANANAYTAFIEEKISKDGKDLYHELSPDEQEEVKNDLAYLNLGLIELHQVGIFIQGAAGEAVEKLNDLVGKAGKATNMDETFESNLTPLKVEQDGSISKAELKNNFENNYKIIKDELEPKLHIAYDDAKTKESLLNFGVEYMNISVNGVQGTVETNPLFSIIFGSSIVTETTEVPLATTGDDQEFVENTVEDKEQEVVEEDKTAQKSDVEASETKVVDVTDTKTSQATQTESKTTTTEQTESKKTKTSWRKKLKDAVAYGLRNGLFIGTFVGAMAAAVSVITSANVPLATLSAMGLGILAAPVTFTLSVAGIVGVGAFLILAGKGLINPELSKTNIWDVWKDKNTAEEAKEEN